MTYHTGDLYVYTDVSTDDTDLFVVGTSASYEGYIHTYSFRMTDAGAGTSPTDKAEMVYNGTAEAIDFNFL